MLVVELRSAPHAGFLDLAQPLRAIALRINLLAPTGNPPTAVDRLHPTHHPSEIFADGQVTARQFLQLPHSLLAVIHRTKHVRAQQLGQLPRIDAVTLAPFLQQSIPAGIAHHQFGDVRLDQVIQPGRPGTFFKRDVQAPA